MSSNQVKHTTQKSFKTNLRDKPRHSDKLDRAGGAAKKGGAGGKGTWGAPGDELKFGTDGDYALDEHDPNYESDDDSNSYFMPPPSEPVQRKFVSSVKDLNKFKEAIKTATLEFLNSNDKNEFAQILKDLDMSLYHQDVPYIVIKTVLDKSSDEHEKVQLLFQYLADEDIVTAPQMTQGFRKVYNSLDDLSIDAPNAGQAVAKFTEAGVLAGFLSKEDADDMQEAVKFVHDAESVKKGKEAIADMIKEYFSNDEIEDARNTLAELKAPHLHFEVVKQMVSKAMDHSAHQREVTSRFLAQLAGDGMSRDEIAKGFNILLERVEDIYLDVPEVLKLLSAFVARAVVDEVLPPAFLLRADLAANDMGFQVIEQAQVLLNQEKAGMRLANVWEQQTRSGSSAEDSESVSDAPAA